MNAATEVKRHKLTQEDCDIARFFTRRGMKLKEIGKIIGVDPSTVGKIQKADFRLETYLEQRKEMNRKTAENKARAEERRAAMLRKGPLDYANDSLIGTSETGKGLTKDGLYRALKKCTEIDEARSKAVREIIKQGMMQPEVPGQMQMDLEPASIWAIQMLLSSRFCII